MQKLLQAILAMFFITVLSNANAADAQRDSHYFLSLSDLHFNPFESCSHGASSCPLKELSRKNVSVKDWAAILEKYQDAAVSYKADTNFSLLQSALHKAGAVAMHNQTKFIVVLGDYLAHGYKENYFKYADTEDKTQDKYRAFVKKTIEFLAYQLSQTFPSQTVFLTVGNNDSYIDDYQFDASDKFYLDMAEAEISYQLIRDTGARAEMQHEIVAGGYYAVDVPNEQNLRLIVMNSVLFSTKAVGSNVKEVAKQELAWLQDQLVGVHAKRQKALILMHIPPGIDLYGTSTHTALGVMPLMKEEYTQKLQTILQEHSANISGILAGHFHMDYFQLLEKGYVQPLVVVGTPAISPLFGNNPGFKLFSYAQSDLSLTDFTTYYNALNDGQGWREEYRFNQVYQPSCANCHLAEGMLLLKPEGLLATDYIKYFSVGTESQPISVGAWLPYYWCGTKNITADSYQSCVKSMQWSELKKEVKLAG